MTNPQPSSKKIVWLASYPKSGNTWFRAFISALLTDGNVDINKMEKTNGIFSSRSVFDANTDLDSRYLYDYEVKLLQPDVYNYLALKHDKDRLFIKIHDAYTLNNAGKPIIPTTSTLCAIYFIRNPLDIAASLANHNATNIDEAVTSLNNTNAVIAGQLGNYNLNNQFPQLICDWSGHVKTWTTSLPFPVLVMRYEDMIADSFATFKTAVKFIGIDCSDEEIKNAIAATSFEQLKKKEKENGFVEKMPRSSIFFRLGVAGNWTNELTFEQAKLLIAKHRTVMDLFDYSVNL